jgi:hypothetical protein
MKYTNETSSDATTYILSFGSCIQKLTGGRVNTDTQMVR